VLKANDLLSGCAWTEVEEGVWARRTIRGKLRFDDTLDFLTAEIDSEIIQEIETERFVLPPQCEFGALIEPHVEATEELTVIGYEHLHKDTGFDTLDRFANLKAQPILPSDTCYGRPDEKLEKLMLMVPRPSETKARLSGYNSAEEGWLAACEQQGIDVQRYIESFSPQT
jgi:hypothetical protein